jgi:hypothetical protein
MDCYKCKIELSSPGAMITENVTYPFCVVKINSKKIPLNKKMPLEIAAFFL